MGSEKCLPSNSKVISSSEPLARSTEFACSDAIYTCRESYAYQDCLNSSGCEHSNDKNNSTKCSEAEISCRLLLQTCVEVNGPSGCSEILQCNRIREKCLESLPYIRCRQKEGCFEKAGSTYSLCRLADKQCLPVVEFCVDFFEVNGCAFQRI